LTQDVEHSGIVCLPLNFIPTSDRIQRGTGAAQCGSRFAVEVPPTQQPRARAAANGLTSRLEAPSFAFVASAAGAGHIAFTSMAMAECGACLCLLNMDAVFIRHCRWRQRALRLCGVKARQDSSRTRRKMRQPTGTHLVCLSCLRALCC
jgi:hypothetical protein